MRKVYVTREGVGTRKGKRSPRVEDTIFGHDTRVSVTGNSSAGSRA